MFAIDGAKAPFILREMSHRQYQIVSDCCLWNALESKRWGLGVRVDLYEDRLSHFCSKDLSSGLIKLL